VRAGADATIDLGAGITVSSTTNTFTDLVPGVTLSLAADTAVGATGTVDVQRDANKMSTAVSDLVTAMNAILTEIDKDTAYVSGSNTGGVLSGDAGVRNLRSSILGTVFSQAGTTLSSVGISTTRDGTLTFDATTFATAYAADPAGTAARFTSVTDGFATRVAKAADAASDPIDGSVTTSITGRKTGIDRLQSSIDDWDRRLELRRTTLERQYTALETALSQMNSQSSWLSSQLSSLSSSSSSSS
ncbi:MAG TPA: flagellar filament capping protein FliD, partial [Nocardioides sp.]|nr:flagellar filament capping protein FliD [Nocardioides sp.]